jgi:hypothetical protein
MIGPEAKAGWETHREEEPLEEKDEDAMDETTKKTLYSVGGILSLLGALLVL